MAKIKAHYFLAAAACIASARVYAATPLETCLSRQADKQGFSGAILVSTRSSTVTLARGRLDGPDSGQITTNTRFDLGSSSKMFTAVSVLQLVEAGKLDLDQTVGHYVKGLTSAASQVTLRQLLSHTSGLGNFFQPNTRDAVQKAGALKDLVPLISAETPAFTPGSRYQYSNTGYLLLGIVIEQASDLSYADYIRRHIFEPAHMASTTLDPGLDRNRAHGWTAWTAKGPAPADAKGAPPPLHPSWATDDKGSSAGAMFSTVNDMRRFFSALVGGKLLSMPTLRTMAMAVTSGNPSPLDGPGGMGMGLGLASGTYKGHHWIGHSGGLPGANAETNMFPNDDITVIVLANRDPPASTQLYGVAREALFDPGFLMSCSNGSTVSHGCTPCGRAK